MRKYLKETLAFLFVIGFFTGVGEAEQEREILETGDLLNISFEELLEVEIISASRTEHSLDHLSVPVSVLTAEEIHASGVTNIPEALQLIPGVDVQRMDRSRYTVGVRGMMSRYSDRTLVLINGRDALNVTIGSPDWLSLPVLMEDIDRIEVVRGPGGAVWGANAFTGVINIITKSPDQTESMASGTVSHFGDVFTHLRGGQQRETCDWYVSVGYDDLKSSDDAGAGTMHSSKPLLNGLIGFNSMSARDFHRAWRMDSQVDWRLNQQSDLSLGAAHASTESGSREFVGRDPKENESHHHTRLFTRWDVEHSDTAASYIQWYGNHEITRMPQMVRENVYYQNDIEAQHSFKLHSVHQVSVGGNVRWLHTESGVTAQMGEIQYSRHSDEYWAGLFAVDRIQLSPRWDLEGQGRLDYYSVTHFDWSARLAALTSLDEAQKHHLRFGFARAYRSPSVAFRETTLTGLGGLFNVLLNPNGVKNESTYAIELGYNSMWTSDLSVRADVYYQRMEDLIGTTQTFVGPVSNNMFANVGGADTYGFETEWMYRLPWGRVTAWYAFNKCNLDNTGDSIRAFQPIKHKLGLRTLWNLPNDWRCNVNYVYNDKMIKPEHSGDNQFDFKPLHRLDLTFSHSFAKERGEVMIGILDVLNHDRAPGYDVAEFTSFTTPGRLFFLRGQFHF